MMLINFAHPLTPTQLAAIEQLSNQSVKKVTDVKTQFDQAKPFTEQARALVESVGLSTQEWQTAQVVINPPSLGVITALLLAELHGRMGYFPSIIRLRPIPESMPPQFEVAEILNLHSVREKARLER